MVVSYGVVPDQILTGPVSPLAERVSRNGFCVIDSGLNEIEVESVQAHFGELQKAYIAKHGLTNLEVLGEEHMIRAPLTLGDKIFSEIALNPNVLELVSQLIQSRFYLSQQNGVINPASQEYSQGRWWHDPIF